MRWLSRALFSLTSRQSPSPQPASQSPETAAKDSPPSRPFGSSSATEDQTAPTARTDYDVIHYGGPLNEVIATYDKEDGGARIPAFFPIRGIDLDHPEVPPVTLGEYHLAGISDHGRRVFVWLDDRA